MPVTRVSSTIWTLLAALMVGLVWQVPAASALDLRVQGRSQLTVDVRTAGTRVIVRGQLRDDLQQPLPQRSVIARLYDPQTDETIDQRETRTNRSGRYAVDFDRAPGTYGVGVRFKSTSHVTGAERTEQVEVERKPVELDVRGPDLVVGANEAVRVTVVATVEGVGLSETIEVEGPGGGVRRVELDEMGRAEVEVTTLLSAGANRLQARLPAGEYRDAAVAETTIRRVTDVSVSGTVGPVFERLQRGAAVDGRLTSSAGPLDGASVEVTLVPADEAARRAIEKGGESDGQSTASNQQMRTKSTRTGPDGSFRLFFGREGLPDGRWRASVRMLPDVGSAVERTLGTFEIDRTLSRIVVNAAAGLALLVLLVVGAREVWTVVEERLDERRRRRRDEERRRRAFDEEETLQPIYVEPEDEEPDRQVDRQAVGGQVWDDWRDRPVAGATLELAADEDEEPIRRVTTGADGRFLLEDLPDGDYQLAITAEYFVRGRFSFEVPHDGQLSNVRFELVAVPLKIRRLYQSLVELVRGEDLWGRLSPRQIHGAVIGVLEGSSVDRAPDAGGRRRFARQIRDLVEEGDPDMESAADYLEALTDIVEETYFSPRVYGEPTWQLARRIAMMLRERIESTHES